MRRPIITAAAALAASLCLPALAQSQLPEITVLGKAAPPARYYMDHRDVHEVSGRYAMSDGSSLVIRDHSRKLHFDIDGRRVKLYAVGHQVYSTASRDVTLAFVPDDARSVVAITYVPTAALAQVNPPRIAIGAFASR
jgi:hypothetical protein